MTEHAESLLTIRKEDFTFLMRHCCNCSHISGPERITVESIQAAVCPKKRTIRGSNTAQKRFKTVDDFLRCVRQWRSTQLMIVTDRERYENMVRALTLSPTITSGSHNDENYVARNLVELGVHLANLVSCSISKHMSQKSFSHFQSLIFLSYCLYLTKKGAPKEEIDDILKVVAREEKKRKRLLTQAAEINSIIVRLGKKGWDVVRATELFLICPLSIYNLLNLSRKDLQNIFVAVSAAKTDFTGCLTPSYTIPGLIERLIRQSGVLEHDSVEVIGGHLGYDPDTMPATSDHIDQVHDAALNRDNISLVQPAIRKTSQVSENSLEGSIMPLIGEEMVSNMSQKPPSSTHILNVVYENTSALIDQPRKRPRLELQIGEGRTLEHRSTPHGTNTQTITRELSPQGFGATSNSLGTPGQSLISTPASPQCTASNSISYGVLGLSQLDSSTGLRLKHRSQQGVEAVPYTVYNVLPTSALESQDAQHYMDNLGPQIQLCDLRVVPDTAKSISLAISGNIKGLQDLFTRGLASPKDVSYTRQYSLLRWALYGGMSNYLTAKFLLDCGADVDDESYQHVWDFAYRKKCTITELHELKCIAMRPPRSYIHTDWVDEQKFQNIHNIVLGRCSESLSAEIDANPNAVRLTDAINRTALDWATALAKLPDMRILIDHGSPLNTMDVSGRTTVLHAVDSHNDDALRMVLEAGADPNPKLSEGLYRSSPLIAATFGGLVGMMKLLLEHGAEVDACNPEGRTALHTVASMQNTECAQILLDHGADLGCMNSNGPSPIITAVVHNNHAVLELFIAQCNSSCLERFQLLPIIAESADAETMSILATSDLLKETLDEDGFAAGCKTLQSRIDYDEALGNAFEGLCRRLPLR